MRSSLILKQTTLKNFDVTFFRNLRTILKTTPSRTVINPPPNPALKEEHKTNNKEARNDLKAILGIKEIEALQLISSYNELSHSPPHLINKNYSICMESKLTKKHILEYPFVLYDLTLERKIAKLKQLPFGLCDSIPLTRLGIRMLNAVLSNTGKCVERIYNLCGIFKITPAEACDIISNKPFMALKSWTELEETLNILQDYEFTRDDILKDLYVFRYSEALIRNRLDFVKDRHITSLKTWMIRCPEETLYKHIKRESDNRDILGEHSMAQYLSEKLNCSETVAKNIIKRVPQLQNKSLLKMNMMIDLLYKAGFTPLQICYVPKVFLHSIETIEQRIKQLKSLGKKPDSVYILTKSQRQYRQYIDNLVSIEELCKENTEKNVF